MLKLHDTEADYVFSFVSFEKLATPIDYQILPENFKEKHLDFIRNVWK